MPTLTEEELARMLRRAREEGWRELALRREGSFYGGDEQMARLVARGWPADHIARVAWLSPEVVRTIASFESLTGLDLSGNGIGDEGTRALASLKGLTSLGLNDSRISNEGARVLASLRSLASLDLSANKIGDEGVHELALLKGIIAIDLGYNRIGAEGGSVLASLSDLVSLDLGGNKIGDEGTSGLASLRNLTFLGLDGNGIGTAGVQSLTTLTSLTDLRLGSNKIGDEGACALASLQNLNSLHLGHNRIGAEGAIALALLRGLTFLGLDGNSIGTAGVQSFATLTSLTDLRLRGNNIGDGGARALTSLQSLIFLGLNSNGIGDEGVRALASLKDLAYLHLQDNVITSLRFVSQMPALSELYACNNHVTGIPAELLGGFGTNCLPALRAYWRDLAQASVCNETVKVLLVGNGCVGKTTLAHGLAHGRAPDVPVVERTHGVELQTVELGLSRGERATLHLWDFGGQERYHAMHRLFVHRNALYLLLWAEETDEAADEARHPATYWFELVERLAPGAEVLLVKNQIDRSNKRGRPEGLEGRELRRVAQVEVSALKYWGIDALKAALSEMVQGACHLWGYLLPKSWHDVRATLEAWCRSGAEGGSPLRSLSLGRFEQLCLEHGVSDAGVLLGFLHDTGEVYHQAGRFNDSIVLDQGWFIDALYRLFDRKSGAYDSARRLGGELKGADFRGYWPDEGEAECETYFDFLLQTGIAFELGCAPGKPMSERTLVVPALLPDACDECLTHVLEPWAEAALGESWLRLEYPVLHRGLVERVIVELSELSKGRSWWRDGLVVRDPVTECTICLSAVPREGRLDLRLRKGRHDEAFARVLATLGTIMRRAPERVLVSADGEVFVGLEVLVQAERAGDTHVVTTAGRAVALKDYDRFVPFARPSRRGQGLVPERAEPKPTRIFISWSQTPDDRPHLESLEKRLKGLKRLVAIDFWHGGQVFAGADVVEERYKRLEVADVVLLLVSPDFMESDECFSGEMELALKKYDAGRGAVVPILVRPTAFLAEHQVGRHQALPSGGKAISQWPAPYDEGWVEVVEGLRALLKKQGAGG